MEKIYINDYEIKWNSFYKMWQVSHNSIGSCIAEFKILTDAINYCERG